MRYAALALFAAMWLPAAAASARADAPGQEAARDGNRDGEPAGGDRRDGRGRAIASEVAQQPLRDTNLRTREIPPLLLRVAAAPYAAMPGASCARIGAAVVELDAVLGPDLDAPADAAAARRDRTGEIAGEVVSGVIIPFRGVVREVSGASASERRREAAIEAGLVRRAYLKGLGFARGCRPPAAPQGS